MVHIVAPRGIVKEADDTLHGRLERPASAIGWAAAVFASIPRLRNEPLSSEN
jgi:hypothetical protein